jgi:tetratricopeptide (TPR) repeat protein
MPSKPLEASKAMAQFLRQRRRELGLTLRQVQTLSEESGKSIPHSTLARIESGRLDPGVRRLHQLLRLYRLPAQAAGDLLDLESVAGAVPFERDPLKLRDAALAAWRAGRVPEAMACFFEFRERATKAAVPPAIRHEAVLSFAVAASSLGKHRISRHVLEDLLLEKPGVPILVSTLIQLSVAWRSLGSTEAALAFLERAAVHVGPKDHRRRLWVEHQRALVHIDLEDFDAAGRHLALALEAARKAKSPRDQSLLLISFANLAYGRRRGGEAVAAGRRAAEFARKNGFGRLRLFAELETARGLQLEGDHEGSRKLLRSVLADSLTTDDNVIRFHAHYYLWKTELAGGEPARADVELREAAYFVRFVDQSSPEVTELHRNLGRDVMKPSP